MNKIVGIAVAVVLLLLASVFVLSSRQNPAQKSTTQETETVTPQASGENNTGFANPKKAAHFESNTPEHGDTLAGVPINVVINFNFDLVKPSSIIISPWNKGREIFIDKGVGETIIDSNKLSMRRKMNSDSLDDLYTVNYKACWADGSCHDGNFQFVIDRKLAQEFVDMTGKKEVTIDLKDIAFNPKNIKISKGTKVTWVNQDSAEHTVNTDSHPAHTYYLSQNSRTLKKGDSYSVSFTEAGIYPYHCTPHAASMKGSVLVE